MKDEMYYIGKVEKVCKISKKTLRYYDKLGVLSPDAVHDENGYRYYSKENMLSIPVIKYYKQSGFKLEEIKNLIDLTDDNLFTKLNSTEPLSEKNEESAKNSLKNIIQEKIDILKEHFEKESELLANIETSTRVKNIIKLKHKELSTFESFLNNLNAKEPKPQTEQS